MVDVNSGRKDGQTDRWLDRRTENWMPVLHLAKAGAKKNQSNLQPMIQSWANHFAMRMPLCL